MIKKMFVHLRTSVKLLLLIILGLAIILGITVFIYKPIYKVTLNGESIGYTENKAELQGRINDYIKSGDNENIAFVEIENLPEYKMCLLKKDNETNDEQILTKVIESGVPYYKYYAILQDSEEKMYVKTFEEAEEVINQLKEKNSTNKDSISYALKYEKEMKELSDTDKVVASLYIEQPQAPVTTQKNSKVAKVSKTSESFSTSSAVEYSNTSLGISLAKPISSGYRLTSRFGERSSIRSSVHTGLDIAISSGVPISAASSGTVIFAGSKGSYGKLVIISHGNGVQTYYAHCSKIYVTVGQTVAQGQIISAVGSTGNSTGPHLHFEIRVNGVAKNPQNYLY